MSNMKNFVEGWRNVSCNYVGVRKEWVLCGQNVNGQVVMQMGKSFIDCVDKLILGGK